MIIVSIILILINCVALPLLSHYCLKFRCYLKELYKYPYIKRICDLLFSSKCILIWQLLFGCTAIWIIENIGLKNNHFIGKLYIFYRAIHLSIIWIFGTIRELNL